MTTALPSPCEVCAGTAHETLFSEALPQGATFSVARCQGCGLVATRPQPTEAFLAELYGSASYRGHTVSGAYCLDDETSGPDFPSVLVALEGLAPGRRLLDVGCGAGAFVASALDGGWDAHGLEPSSYASVRARERLGDRVRATVLERGLWPPRSFDAVTLWYVLEHVRTPAALVALCEELLVPGGVLFVAVPNWRYIRLRRRLAQLRGGGPGTVHPGEHLFQYTSRTAAEMLRRQGLAVLEERCASPYLVSGAALNLAKRAAHVGVKALFALTGLNMSGILLFARRSG